MVSFSFRLAAFDLASSIVKGSGNYSLVRLLPQLYSENREPIHAYLPSLLRLLRYPSTDVSEKLSLLQLASMTTAVKPDVGFLIL